MGWSLFVESVLQDDPDQTDMNTETAMAEIRKLIYEYGTEYVERHVELNIEQVQVSVLRGRELIRRALGR